MQKQKHLPLPWKLHHVSHYRKDMTFFNVHDNDIEKTSEV
jgi:hypothetical protein